MTAQDLSLYITPERYDLVYSWYRDDLDFYVAPRAVATFVENTDPPSVLAPPTLASAPMLSRNRNPSDPSVAMVIVRP